MNSEAPFRIDQTKAIQAVAFLLKQKRATKTDNYMRLLKLLYVADRESLQETGRPITGDRFMAMEHGPSLSHLLDLARQRTFGLSEWDKYIELNEYEITLIQDPGNERLCPYDVDKLMDVYKRFQGFGPYKVAKETEKFREWIKNKPEPGGRNYISLSDVLDALGRQDWFDAILEDAQDDAEFTRRFAVG